MEVWPLPQSTMIPVLLADIGEDEGAGFGGRVGAVEVEQGSVGSHVVGWNVEFYGREALSTRVACSVSSVFRLSSFVAQSLKGNGHVAVLVP